METRATSKLFQLCGALLAIACGLIAAASANAQNYPATLSNTANVTMPPDVADPAPGNNTATDTNTLAAQSALSITKTLLSTSPAAAGSSVRYRLQIANGGPSAAIGATVSDTVPPQLSAVSWTCTPSAGASCAVGSGTGNVSVSLNLAAGANVVIDVSATAPTTTPSTIGANTATLTPPPGTTDPNPGDNTSTTPPIPVTPHAIVALDDHAGPIDGGPGQTNVVNVLANDTLDGVPVLAAQIVLAPVTAGPLTIRADGGVDAAAATPTGVYTASYTLCEAANPSNCDPAQVTVTVNAAATIDAIDDAFAPQLAGAIGALGNVLGNDTLNGGPVGALVTLTSPPGGVLSIAADGTATLDPGAAAGVHSVAYQICEIAFPGNCDSAVASVRVFPPLDAAPDVAGPINGTAGAVALINVLGNDTANGATPASLSAVTLVGASTPQIVFNADGTITVPPGTPAGTHTASYTLCYIAAPALCDSATVQVTALAPGALIANDDSYTGIDGVAGNAAVGNVRTNDSLNGGPASAALVSIAPVTSGPITIAADGTVSIAAGTPAGTYTATYQACETALPDNCDTADVSATVATISAGADAFPATRAGASAGNVLGNDFANGAAATSAQVTLTVLSASPGLVIAADGATTIAAGTAAGPLTARYRICLITAPALCSEADVAVTVAAGTLIAVDDTLGPANGSSGGSAGNVLDNDTLDGVPAVIGPVTLTPVTSGPITIGADGTVTVAPNTPPGAYNATYTLCEAVNPANCDSATVVVTVSVMDAQDDLLGPINGAVGGPAGNVLSNDALNGTVPPAVDVILTPANAGPITIGADGSVVITPGTPPGTYTAGYTVCAQAAPTICDTASVSVNVIAIAALDAVSDVIGPVDGAAGSANAGNVLLNDTRDGVPVAPGSVTITPSVTAPLAIAADGTVSVAPNTPSGVYNGGYQICEVTQPDNCDTTTVTVIVRVAAVLAAQDDGPFVVDGRVGNNNVGNLLANDTYNGAAIVPGSVTFSHTASAPVSVAADGTVSVSAGAAAGDASFTYTICDAQDPPNCDSATATLRISTADAHDDALSSTGAGVAGNVLANDVLDGAAATTATVIVSGTLPAPLTLAPDGTVSVAPNTPQGIYAGTYTMCSQAAPAICDSAVVSVTVAAGVLAANDDSFGPVDGVVGGNVGNVLGNDALNGAAITPGSVVLTAANAAPISIAADGTVTVAPGAVSGTYSAGYTLCEVLNPGNCDTAQVTVSITTLDASNDSLGPVNGALGGAAGNVLDNDRLNGAAIPAGAVTLTPVVSGPVSIAANGGVTIAAGTAPGAYSASYTICQTALPASCDGATVSVAVVSGAAVDAVNDLLGPISAATGSANAGNVLANDRLNGAPLANGQVTLLPSSSAPLAVAADGTVSVAPGSAPGLYSGVYQICETADPSNCDSATFSVRLSAIDAFDDSFILASGVAGGEAGQVFANDRLDNAAFTAADVLISSTLAAPLSLGADGRVMVAPNTPAGSYGGNYTICMSAAPTICDSAAVQVTVGSGTLAANDDLFGPVNGFTGGALPGNVLGNDTLDGVAVTPANVVLTPNNVGPISIAGNGTVSIAAGASAGVYVAGYTLCEALNPANCDPASVRVTVTTLEAADDALGPINGTVGGNAGNVLVNDRLDDAPIAAGSVVLTATTSAPITIATDGTVGVTPGAAPGVYTATYQICQSAQPAICDSASVSVRVVASAALDAVDDLFGPVDGATGNASVGSVLANDRYDGGVIVPGQIVLTSTATAPLAIAPNGNLSVAAGTAAGVYTASYTICDAANPANCDTAGVTVTVTTAAVIDAVNDGPYVVDGAVGSANAGNVLINDTFNGGPVNLANVTLSSTASGQLSLGADGTVVVQAGAAPGLRSFTYTLCETARPTNCDTATVSVNIVATDARNDAFALADGVTGGIAGNVLINDVVNGLPTTVANGSLTGQFSAPLSLAADGTLVVAPNTPAGVYTGNYTLCALAAPSVCDTAPVTVIVATGALPVTAADDSGNVRGRTGGIAVVSVLLNDRLGGAPPLPSQTTLALVTPASNPGVVFDASTGAVTVVAATPANTYALRYRVCQRQAPANCAEADVQVVVTPAQIDAVNDAAGPFNGRDGAPGVVRVTANDTLDGVPVNAADVTVEIVSIDAPLQLQPDGQVNLRADTAHGAYGLTYRLCETANPSNCDTATVTVTVGMPAIDAIDDIAAPVPGGMAHDDVINVLSNDWYDGVTANTVEVRVTPVTQGPLTLQADGTVDLAAGTAGGTYLLNYQICDAINPSNCDTATAQVSVMATALTAANDTTETPQNTAISIAVLGNDQFAGAAVDPQRIVLAIATPPQFGQVQVNTDGSLLYTPTTNFSGADTFQYSLCEQAAPANCVTASVAITVQANTLVLVDDAGETRGAAITLNVLANDTTAHAALDPASLSVAAMPQFGQASCAAGMCSYTPNEGYVGQDRFTYQVCDVSTPTPVCAQANVVVDVQAAPAVLRLSKQAERRTAKVGDLVRYTIRIENVGDVDAVQVPLTDTLPPGFFFVAGTLQVADGDGVAAPSGVRPLRIDGLDIAVGQSATLSYVLRVGAGAGPGIHTNRAIVREDDGTALSNEATADVEVTGDPMLDDSLIVGTVFHDANGNGRQDDGERGLPGVRIGTVEGVIVETDRYGRFHLVGIDGGQWARGRNFLMKVDVSTLPPGSTFTTENPRVQRITPGVPVRFDFGVQVPGVPLGGGHGEVSVELGEILFAHGSAEIPAEHAPLFDRMAARLREAGGGRVAITANAGDFALAFQRASAARDALDRRLDAPLRAATRIELLTQVGDVTALVTLDKDIALGNLLFDTDSAQLRPQYLALLDAIAQRIEHGPDTVVGITGHADARGPDERNLQLSRRRADAVAKALAARLSPQRRAQLQVTPLPATRVSGLGGH